jgi:hypothetical protein
MIRRDKVHMVCLDTGVAEVVLLEMMLRKEHPLVPVNVKRDRGAFCHRVVGDGIGTE